MIFKKFDTLPIILQDILKLATSLAEKLGFKLYLVGGVVRDLILERGHFDLDFVVEGDAILLAHKLALHLNKELRRHHSFGTATVYYDNYKIDFATARKEYYPHWGALPQVTASGIKDDLFRRDFTINALAISMNKENFGELIDFYGGVTDLKNRIIKIHHPNSFLDDPTRILRGVRFEQRFSFKIEKGTFNLMKEAINLDALKFVHHHRLRDELILMMKEPSPYREIKRLNQLVNLSFIDENVKLDKKNVELLLKIEKILPFCKDKFKKSDLDEAMIYFAALFDNFPYNRLPELFVKLGLRKREMLILLSIGDNHNEIKRLEQLTKPHEFYGILKTLPMESILYFYIYYPNKKIRETIEYFLEVLVHIHLKVRGGDLKKMGIKPFHLYSRILETILYIKIDKELKTKEEELKEVIPIFEKIKASATIEDK